MYNKEFDAAVVTLYNKLTPRIVIPEDLWDDTYYYECPVCWGRSQTNGVTILHEPGCAMEYLRPRVEMMKKGLASCE